MKFKNIVVLSDNPQLLKYHKRWVKTFQETDMTWCSLFKTKSYKRMMKHKEFLYLYLDRYIKKNITKEKWYITHVPTMGYVLFY